MSIIQTHRFRESRNASPDSGELPAAVVTAYAHALAEARILSFKLHIPQTDAPARRSSQISGRRGLLSVPFRMILFRIWGTKRVHAQRIRELERVLHQLDPHTLRDIGFDVMKEKANHPHAWRSNALVHAIKAVCEDRLTPRAMAD